MQPIITFVANNWELFLALAIISALLGLTGSAGRLRGIKSANPAEVTQLINHEGAIVIDVREEKEFVEGHIINSIHIPLAKLNNRISELEKFRDKPIVVSCRSGNRSGNACAVLKKEGFESVYNLSGGIMAWQNASLPVSK
jgi:rhodanese-related sulfurtransferase